MKKTKIILLSVIFLSGTVALAQTAERPSAPTQTRSVQNEAKEVRSQTQTATEVRTRLMEMKEDAIQMRTEARNQMQTATEAGRETRETASQAGKEIRDENMVRKMALIKNQLGMMLNRFTSAIMRLNLIADRIESHITKLEEAGRNMDSAKTGMEIARAKIADATENLAELKTALERALESETPRDALAEIRLISEDTKTIIKEAHTALVDVIKELKPGTRDGTSQNQNENLNGPEENNGN